MAEKQIKQKIITERDYCEVISTPEAGIRDAKGPKTIPMFPPALRERVERVLIPEACLEKRIKALAREISHDYSSVGVSGISIVYILEGAFMFASDLERRIYKNRSIEVYSSCSLKASTYGKEIKRTGEVRRNVKIIHMPDVRGMDVLLVEDIVDQGFTLEKIIGLLKEKKVRSLKVCVLLNKILKNPSPEAKRLRKRLDFDYVGFEIPDRWVAGYGVDASGDFRDLPFIITVNEKFYLQKK